MEPTFKIYRESWLRGEGTPDSYLLRPVDKKMCCLGQVACQAGVPLDDLRYIVTIGNIESYIPPILHKFLQEDRFQNDPNAITLMQINDDGNIILDADREKRLVEEFNNIGVTIEFVDGIAPWFQTPV